MAAEEGYYYHRPKMRTCCDSDESMWHSHPCTVNGPQLYPADVTEDGALSTSVGLPTYGDFKTYGELRDYFAGEQTVIKPSLPDWATDRTYYRVRHDTVSSDRTFENETRLY